MAPKNSSEPNPDSLAPLRRNLVNWLLALIFVVSMVFLYYASESRVEVDSDKISTVDQTLNGEFGELGAKLGVAMNSSNDTVIGFRSQDQDLAGLSSRGYSESIGPVTSYDNALGSVESRTRDWDRIFDLIGYDTIDVAGNDSLLSLSDEVAGYRNDKIYCQTRARVLDGKNAGEVIADASVHCAGITELEWQTELSEKITNQTQVKNVSPLFHIDEESVTNNGIWRRASGSLYELKNIGDLAVQVDNDPLPVNYYRKSSDLVWLYGYSGGSLPRCSEIREMNDSDIVVAFADFGCFNDTEQITTIDEYQQQQ